MAVRIESHAEALAGRVWLAGDPYEVDNALADLEYLVGVWGYDQGGVAALDDVVREWSARGYHPEEFGPALDELLRQRPDLDYILDAQGAQYVELLGWDPYS